MKKLPPAELATKDLVPTFDFAGTVVEAPGSSTFCPGDEVYATTNPRRTGCARDYAIALSGELAHRSQRLTWAESAALPLSAQTAWQALFIHAGLDGIGATHASGKRVLVTAAAGGVGAWVVQLANLAGAEVIGTCGPQNAKLVQSLGAREVIDYHTADIREWGQSSQNQVDIVIDCVGGKALEDAWWAVRDGGILISVVQPPEMIRPANCTAKNINNFFFIIETNGSQLERITKLVDEGKCRPFVDSLWRLEDYQKAFERADSWRAAGKVVLDLMAIDEKH